MQHEVGEAADVNAPLARLHDVGCRLGRPAIDQQHVGALGGCCALVHQRAALGQVGVGSVIGDPHVRAAIAQERRERRAVTVEPVEDDPPAGNLLLGVGIHRGAVWMSS